MTLQIQPLTPPPSSASIPQPRIVSSVRHSKSQHAVQAVVRAVLLTKWSAVSVSLHCDAYKKAEVESVRLGVAWFFLALLVCWGEISTHGRLNGLFLGLFWLIITFNQPLTQKHLFYALHNIHTLALDASGGNSGFGADLPKATWPTPPPEPQPNQIKTLTPTFTFYFEGECSLFLLHITFFFQVWIVYSKKLWATESNLLHTVQKRSISATACSQLATARNLQHLFNKQVGNTDFPL